MVSDNFLNEVPIHQIRKHGRDINWWLSRSVGTNKWFYRAIWIQIGCCATQWGYELVVKPKSGDISKWLCHRVGI